MTKANIKKMFGKYCDTDKLVDDMIELLTKNGHRCTEHGVCCILKEYFTNKEPLIKLLMTSKYYTGDMRIISSESFQKRVNHNQLRHFCEDFPSEVDAQNFLIKKVDKDGKTIGDYLKTGRKSIDVHEFNSTSEIYKTFVKQKKNLSVFDTYGNLNESVTEYNNFIQTMHSFGNITSPTFAEETHFCGVKIHKGMKTSRAFNKICTHYGVDKSNPTVVKTKHDGVVSEKTIYPYDKLFAQYSDMVAGGTKELDFIISANPLDYLTMSVGESWTSCHHIRTGGYKQGCVSYMLDEVSLVTFVIPKYDADTNLQTTGKVYREMIHCKGTTILQARIYPQGNDGCTDLYSEFRGFITKHFGEMLHVDSSWTCNKGYDSYRDFIISKGRHYKDYTCNSECTMFNPIGSKIETMTIGHNPICAFCGREDNDVYSSSFSHVSCRI